MSFLLTLAAAAAQAAATPAPTPAPAPVGLTDNPCPVALEFSPELVAWRAQVYAPGNRAMIPPPMAPAMAYRTAYLAARANDWADICHFHADDGRLAARPQSERQIIFMGDSITEAWQFGDPTLFGHGVVDRGISGQTTPQMLVRFSADVLALHPRTVHIMGGTNDVAGNSGAATIDQVEANIAAMVTLAKAAGIRVVLAAVPPAGRFTWAPQIPAAQNIAALNARLRALAAREHVTFVDYGAAIGRPDGSMRPELTLDGVHPNAAGYAAMRPLTNRALAGR